MLLSGLLHTLLFLNQSRQTASQDSQLLPGLSGLFMRQQVRIKRPENRQLYDRRYLVVDSLLKCTLVYTLTTQCTLISYKTCTLSSSWDHRDFFSFFSNFLYLSTLLCSVSSNCIFPSSFFLQSYLPIFLDSTFFPYVFSYSFSPLLFC